MTFADRKRARADYFNRFIFRWKQTPCVACHGSGHYDGEGSPPCGGCEGTGKERRKAAPNEPTAKALRRHPKRRRLQLRDQARASLF